MEGTTIKKIFSKMDLAIISTIENSRNKTIGFKSSKYLITINGETLIKRIIRIARQNGAEKVFCIINEQDAKLKKYLNNTDFGIPLKLIVKSTPSSLHSLFTLEPYLKDAPFCLATSATAFPENDFSEFINYSKLQDDIDGVLAISNYINYEKPLCVAMNEEDTILKFSDSKEGYNQAAGGIFLFSPRIFNEREDALQYGILGLENYLKFLIGRNYLLKEFSFSKMIDINHKIEINNLI